MNTDAFPLNYNGRAYNTFAAFCRGEGLPYSRTRARMKAGRPMHEWFVDRPLGRRNSALDTGDYPSVKAMADACGVSYGSLYNRLRTGRAAADAMQKKIVRRINRRSIERPGHQVEYDGRLYPSLGAAAKVSGLSRVVLYGRWNRGKRGADLFAPVRPRTGKLDGTATSTRRPPNGST